MMLEHEQKEDQAEQSEDLDMKQEDETMTESNSQPMGKISSDEQPEVKTSSTPKAVSKSQSLELQ